MSILTIIVITLIVLAGLVWVTFKWVGRLSRGTYRSEKSHHGTWVGGGDSSKDSGSDGGGAG